MEKLLFPGKTAPKSLKKSTLEFLGISTQEFPRLQALPAWIKVVFSGISWNFPGFFFTFLPRAGLEFKAGLKFRTQIQVLEGEREQGKNGNQSQEFPKREKWTWNRSESKKRQEKKGKKTGIWDKTHPGKIEVLNIPSLKPGMFLRAVEYCWDIPSFSRDQLSCHIPNLLCRFLADNPMDSTSKSHGFEFKIPWIPIPTKPSWICASQRIPWNFPQGINPGIRDPDDSRLDYSGIIDFPGMNPCQSPGCAFGRGFQIPLKSKIWENPASFSQINPLGVLLVPVFGNLPFPQGFSLLQPFLLQALFPFFLLGRSWFSAR